MENKDALDKQKVDLEYDRLAETGKTMRSAKLSIFLVFGSFVLWASFVPLDEGVPLIGNVVIDTKRKAVQHASGGVIKEIFVKEGQFVNVDDSLIKLSDLTLLNELAIEKNNTNSLMERITGLKVEKKNFEDLIISTEEQKQFIEEELNGIKSLVEDGFAPKIKQLELERELSQVKSRLKELRNSIEKNQQSILESEFQLEAVEEKIFIIQRKIKGTLIKANFSGQVIDLQKQAVGEVVRSAEKIMDIIPRDERLVIEARVAPNLIDRIRLGDSVDVRFSSFSRSPMLVVEAKIISISADILYDDTGGHYLARAVLTEDGEKELSGRRMQPGMQTQVIVKTGKRTLLSYVIHPLTRRVASSLTEE